ncbi:MAG: long-chain fatty acid--CoA ligase [Gammaproteobacteria bacterium]|nr:MAG: long-chain fatty acid--CoA ligase [Gammaproteobacteria bacterium]
MSLPHSYDEVPMEWVGDLSGRRAKMTPNMEAVTDVATGKRYTYKEMDDRANKLGAYLRDELKVKRGDRICILMTNRIEAIDLYFACGKLGYILSPLSYALHKNELEELLNRIQPKVIFYEDIFAELAETWNMPPSVSERVRVGDSEFFYEGEIMNRPVENVNVPLSMNHTQMYIHTGGTTAVPKICVVPYRQMVWNSFELMTNSLMLCTAVDGELTVMLTFPFFHIGGWNSLIPAYYMGSRVAMLRTFNPELALETIEKEKIVSFGAVEAMLQFMSASPKFTDTDFSSVLALTTAAAPCSEEVLRPFWDKGVRTSQAYGMTEAGPSNFSCILQEGSKEEVEAKAGKIGISMAHCDYKIVDPDTREEVAQGVEGVLCMRSPHNFGGYLNDHWRTEKLFLEGGWVYTGDLAVEDDEGLVSIVGRADNMFISGGENVSPEEIELVLKRHPAVAGAISVGIKDKKWGEAPVALVVVRPGSDATQDDLKDFCASQLARFKIPQEIKFGETLPLTGAGKLDRNALKAMFV